MKILLFTGAGASVELGIPAMRRMVEEFHAHLNNLGPSGTILEQFEPMLSESEYDMEQLIENVESIERGQNTQRQLGLPTNEALFNTSRMMRWEAEWFVHHVCERFREVDAKILWGPVLRKMGDHDLCVATSNYDRGIEIACRFNGVPFDDGFYEFSEMETAKWRGMEVAQDGKLRLIKVHGSTDWYMGDDGAVYKLRHSISLYGSLGLSFVDNASAIMSKMKSAMVLPTREKLVTQPPYPDLITDFRNVAREAEVAILVGTSLRDPDLLDICRQCAERIPTYLVTMNGPPNSPVVPNLRTIDGTASGFLTSTLPKFLVCGDVGYLDDCANGALRTVGTESVLTSLVMALEGNGGVDGTCEAIERLVNCGVMLDLLDIGRLLEREDVAVQKYALALIPKSVDREEAMELAREKATMNKDGTFAEEFRMMEKLMGIV